MIAPKKKVLIVDDMERNRTSIKTFLFFFRFDATLATDGLEAKKILEKDGFDLIVTDLEMPVLNGFELLGVIRKSDRHKLVPVIVLSTLDTPEVKERCMKLGASAYMVKPFTSEKFEAALSALKLLAPTTGK